MRKKDFIDVAARIAMAGNKRKNYLMAALVKRTDGAIVVAENGNTKYPDPSVHAEAKVLRKSDIGCELYVVRVSKKDGSWCMAKPCKNCQVLIRNRGVKKVYYTTGPNEFTCWNVMRDKKP